MSNGHGPFEHPEENTGNGAAEAGSSDIADVPAPASQHGTRSPTYESEGWTHHSGNVIDEADGEASDYAICCARVLPGKSPACGVQTHVLTSANVDAKMERADAQDQSPPMRAQTGGSSKASDIPERLLDTQKGAVSPPGDAPLSRSGRPVGNPPPSAAAHMLCHTRKPKARPSAPIVSEEHLMAPTPEHILDDIQSRDADTLEAEPGTVKVVPHEPAKTETQPLGSSELQLHPIESPDSYSTPEDMCSAVASKPLVGPSICEGDTTLTQNLLPPALINGLLERLSEEVHFKKMMHQGGEVPRFVAVQGTIAPDGTQPIYRHPSDESPPLAAFTPAVQLIRANVEKQLGHPVNHALIQCYRHGNDYISEHSDKTLDVDRWSYIANVSVGAMRTMVFRSKRGERKSLVAGDSDRASGSSSPIETIDKAATKPVDILKAMQPPKRQTTRCPMPHNSLIKMGLVTNEKWSHGIKPDKRPQSEKSAEELAWNGLRISLTFRHITTFLSPSPDPNACNEPVIWGQGAVSKTREHARPVVNGQTPEAVTLLRAFGRENNSPEFDWEANYGCGFDVLHMKAAPRYFGCGDSIVDGRVRIMLAECNVKYARGDIGIDAKQRSSDRGIRGAEVGEVLPVRFVVDDADRTTVVGDIAILLFLDAKHPRKKGSDAEVAGVYSRFYAAIALEQRWKGMWASATGIKKRTIFARLKPHLIELEKWAAEAARHQGTEAEPSIADFALWPVLHDVAVVWKTVARGRGTSETVFEYLGLRALDGYYRTLGDRRSVISVFGQDVVLSVLPEPSTPGQSDDESDETACESVVDEEKSPGKGKLPKLTEFGGDNS